MEDNNNIINFLEFLKDNIDKEEYQSFNDVFSGATNLFKMFDQDNRIYTVNYGNISLIRYLLLENNKILKITVNKIGELCNITHELFSNADLYKVETTRESDGRRRIQIRNDDERLCGNEEYLSTYNLVLLPSKVSISYVLAPITINELYEKFDEIKEKSLIKKSTM